MANPQVSMFTPDTSQGTSFGGSASTVALPGTPASDSVVRVTNLGPNNVAVKLGAATPVAVTPSTGLVVTAGESIYLAVGANTFIGGVSCGGPSTQAQVNLTTGN